MKSEKLFEAMADVDEKYIAEAKVDTTNSKKKPFVKWISIAACFAVILGVGIGIAQSGIFDKTPSVGISATSKASIDDTTFNRDEENETDVNHNGIEIIENNYAITTEINTATKKDSAQGSTGNASSQITTNQKQNNQGNTEGNKGVDTSERLQDYRIGTDGDYYRVFKPGIDKFEPLDNMTLENRFCAFEYNGHSYYPIPDKAITKDDYEPNKLASVKAESWEMRSANANDEVTGIVYYARIDIYKLKGVDPDEEVACVISFNGETKTCVYKAS